VLGGVEGLFGYETLVLRALPFTFFLLASYFWLKLLFTRLGALPLLAVLAFFLLLLPTSWFAYSSMLKQYTFDVLLATLLFVVPDRRLETTLRDGRNLWVGVILSLPCALSYTYVIVLSGRLAGWYVSQLFAGTYRLSVRGLLTVGIGVLVSLASLWLTDIRFMNGSVYGWWESCIPGNDWSSAPALLDQLVMGWYAGKQEFPIRGGLPEPILMILRIAFLLGVIQVARSLRGHALYKSPPSWGSRSIGALLVLVALIGASVVIHYPICSSRLTLFALFPMQIVLFEGFAAIHGWLEESKNFKKNALTLGVIWLCMVVPFSLRDAMRFVQSRAPENIRPAFRILEAHSELPVHVMPCIGELVRAFPNPPDGLEVSYVSSADRIPWGQRVLVVERSRHPGLEYCFHASAAYQQASIGWERLHAESDQIYVYLAEFAEENP